ncbi:MAG: c-type cytochrome domain-containing protein [Bacteroidota bacterium]
MANTLKSKWADYVIFGHSILLVYCLLFEAYIELPPLVAWIGRWHPLILHFPIVLLIIAIFLDLTRAKVSQLLLTIAVLSALLTAISGFFLGKETGSQGELLSWHKWLGTALALLAAIWYGLRAMNLSPKFLVRGMQILMGGLIIFTGHYGGMVTHGEDFLALPLAKKADEIPENPILYTHIVQPILENNCVQCHNPNKQKGGLLMTDISALLKGGESGNTLIPGDPEQSEMIRRLHLPSEDEEHMPPEGERPLQANEIRILERWIALGASDTTRLEHLEPSEPLTQLIRELMQPDPLKKWETLPVVADSTLNRLSSDYLSLIRMAGTTNALKVNAYMPPEYSAQILLDLMPIRENIVELDLSGLPLGQDEMSFAANCPNLEWLEIDKTPISDVEIDTLRNLQKIQLLKVFETEIGDKSIDLFRGWKALKSLYVWDTEISQSVLEEFKSENPGILINTGIDSETKSYFIASDSIPDE